MSIPKQVADAEARSTELIEAFKQAGNEPPKPTEPDPVPVVPEAPKPAAPDTTPAVIPAAPPEERREDWKAKYHSLKGKYDAEVPRLYQQIKETENRLVALETKLAAPAPKPVDDAPDPEDDKFGPEMVAMVKRRIAEATAAVRAELAPVKADAENAGKTVKQVAAQSARDTFIGALTQKVPDWKSLDTQQGFQDFLAGKDRLSRKTRQELIAEAYREGDVGAVADFFDSYKESIAPPAKPAPVEVVDDERSMAHLVTPAQSGRAAATTDTKIWTSKEVNDFYKNVALGKIKPDEAAITERDIAAASKEGRIR